MSPSIPELEALRQAHERIRPYIHRTPIMTSRRIDEMSGAELHFKCENFQHTGAFKFRGALNAVLGLRDDELKVGVATHSSGNHGAALACAANLRGIPAHIVVPKGAVATKVAAIEGYGGTVHWCEPTQAGREQALQQVVEETGAQAVPPYNDPRIIAGQGTAALELLEQRPDLDIIVTPVGGGGLVSGTAIAAAAADHEVKVYGIEPDGAADTRDSLEAGFIIDDFTPDTIADGLRAKVGPLTFEVIRGRVDRVLTVDDAAIIAAMRQIWRIMKIVVEPSCATVLAAVFEHREAFRGKRVGLILSGGNVDLDHLPWQGN
jgi:threonine dehydratase